MLWEKLGQIWAPSGDVSWAQSHAQLPIVQVVAPDRWWVYVSTRDTAGKSRIGRVVLDVGELATSDQVRVCHFEPEPVLSLGEPGTFDDSGVMPAWLMQVGDSIWLYYIGWNVIATVPYRLAIGLAVSIDGGATFRRRDVGPIIDRSRREPFFATAPCVLRDGNAWRMWYVSCTGWQQVHQRWEPAYHVKYAESNDGIDWTVLGHSCVEPKPGYAIGRPCVFRRGNGFAMLYSDRSITDYRSDRNCSYRLGYAESTDGLHWERMDHRVGIEKSTEGWDSEMIEYCWLQQHRDATYLLYNGNGFGLTGFGLARLSSQT